MMFLTTENAPDLVGASLDARQRLFHYYPLTVGVWPSGDLYYQDRNGCCMPVPAPAERFNKVYFDMVKTADTTGG